MHRIDINDGQHEPGISPSRDVLDTIDHDAVLIERAKGVLMALTSTSVDKAFRLMREHSRRQRIPLRQVAADVIARTVTPKQLRSG